MKKNFLKNSLLIALLLLSASCRIFADPMPKSWNWGLKPRPLTGMRNFPQADTEYGKGFKDGCETGWDAVGKGLLADINDHKYDYKRSIKSPDYSTGWWDGFEQCVYIMDWDVK